MSDAHDEEHEKTGDVKSANAKYITPPRYQFDGLAAGSRVVFIEHGGTVYRLICTKSGKLVLQK